jgi:hypothetical protein
MKKPGNINFIRNWSASVKSNIQQNYNINELIQKIDNISEQISKLTQSISLIIEKNYKMKFKKLKK